MGNWCGGSKLQVHVQPSFTYETILDRYIDSHLPELMMNAVQLSDHRSSLPNYTSTWDDLTTQLETTQFDRRLSMRNEAAQKLCPEVPQPEAPAQPSRTGDGQVASLPPQPPQPPAPPPPAQPQPAPALSKDSKESAGKVLSTPGSTVRATLSSKPSLPPIAQRSSQVRRVAEQPPKPRSTEPPRDEQPEPQAAPSRSTTAGQDVLPAI
ncbi:vegetative cell wall protein gp1-like [Amphibalanus amphitrite]|uniref:vegetative cell wall protein gp1-like n=1 Tax=Amphibalanus amphitrite TaxID=1232801 RepID=UPI001C92413D|nr:vegetative cell wall protein gp1-like [Amphibalanus amphitrite]